MKRNLLLGTLLAFAIGAQAHGSQENGSGSNSAAAISGSQSMSAAAALSMAGASGGTASALVGPSSVNVGGSPINIQGGNYNDHRQPVNSAIAPDISSSVICPIISQGSHAVQLLVLGVSTTGVNSVNAICVAFNLGQTAVVEKMTCATDAGYRAANPNCGK